MSELSDDHLRRIVTSAAATVLNDPDRHVERYWQDRKRRPVAPTFGDQAEAGGLGGDIIPEIVAMTQYAWSLAQSHGPNIADNLVADALGALIAALTAALLKWRGRFGKSGLSEEERPAVVTEVVRGTVAALEENSQLPSIPSTKEK